MGDRSFSTFQTNLSFNLGNRDDLSTYVDDWVNTAYRTLVSKNYSPRFGRRFVFPEIETDTSSDTTDGTAYVSVPTGCLFIQNVWDSTSDNKLHNIGWPDYVAKTGRADTSSEGAPDFWVRRGSNVYLYKTPDATYSLYIYYRQKVDDMSAGSDTTLIGEEWDEIIQKLATIQSLMRLGEYEKAKLEKEDYLGMLSDLLGIYENEDADRDSIRKPDYAYINFDNWR